MAAHATSASGGAVPMAQVDARGQCLPAYMSVTVGAFPRDPKMLQASALPFGVLVQPMAEGEGSLGAGAVPLVNFGAAGGAGAGVAGGGVVRCKKCRAYINPFARFIDSGRRWKCNFCAFVNDVPASYFSPTDAEGVRADLAQRPELTQGSVEFVAPAEYMVRPPQPPVYVFVIDVSFHAVQCGMLAVAAEAIRASLDRMQGDGRTQVGFVTFDSAVHFYSLKAKLRAPQMLVVPDIADLFVPVPDELLVNLAESRAQVEALLAALPSMFAGTRAMETCRGPALDAAFQVCHTVGGKMVVLTACLPTVGAGRLSPAGAGGPRR
jgi:protein transport protein SEC24